MNCLSPEQLAAEGAAADPHLADCLVCRRAVAEQREMRELLRQVPSPTLTRRDREAMAAELLARAELADDRAQLVARRGRTVAVAGAGLAAAAVLALVLGRDTRVDSAGVELATSAPHAAPTSRTAPLPPTTGPVAAARTHGDDAAPALSVATPADAGPGSAVEPVPVAPAVRLRDRTSTVVAGSRENAARIAVERDRLDPVPSPAQLALAEFRDGWTALRAGRNADARAAFDRATDPVVAEDAMYWAAVASERAGDRADAAARFTAFVVRYPDSPRSAAARAAVDRLR